MPLLAEILRRHTDRLMSITGVVGIGESACEGVACILILVSNISDVALEQIPKEIEGYRVVLQEIGEVRAMNMKED